MPLYKFGPNDVYHNTIRAYPSCSFFIYDEQVYYNNKTAISGAFIDGRDGINKTGYINLYELNIDNQITSIETIKGISEGEMLLFAIMYVESGNDSTKWAKGEDAVGCLQIRKIAVSTPRKVMHLPMSK